MYPIVGMLYNFYIYSVSLGHDSLDILHGHDVGPINDSLILVSTSDVYIVNIKFKHCTEAGTLFIFCLFIVWVPLCTLPLRDRKDSYRNSYSDG